MPAYYSAKATSIVRLGREPACSVDRGLGRGRGCRRRRTRSLPSAHLPSVSTRVAGVGRRCRSRRTRRRTRSSVPSRVPCIYGTQRWHATRRRRPRHSRETRPEQGWSRQPCHPDALPRAPLPCRSLSRTQQSVDRKPQSARARRPEQSSSVARTWLPAPPSRIRRAALSSRPSFTQFSGNLKYCLCAICSPLSDSLIFSSGNYRRNRVQPFSGTHDSSERATHSSMLAGDGK